MSIRVIRGLKFLRFLQAHDVSRFVVQNWTADSKHLLKVRLAAVTTLFFVFQIRPGFNFANIKSAFYFTENCLGEKECGTWWEK